MARFFCEGAVSVDSRHSTCRLQGKRIVSLPSLAMKKAAMLQSQKSTKVPPGLSSHTPLAKTIMACSKLLLFAGIVLLHLASSSGANSVVRNDTNCKWTRPLECEGEPTYKILLHFVENQGHNETFPVELKAPVRAAAKLWSRAIVGKQQPRRGMRSSASKQISWLAAQTCKLDTSFRIDQYSILVCVRYNWFLKRTIARAGPIQKDSWGDLPLVSVLDFNPEYAGEYDYCFWANVALHELAHALGFEAGILPFQRHVRGRASFGGGNARQEWAKLNTTMKRPPLSSRRDLSHWSKDCFFHEVMHPEADLLWDMGRRVPLSRVTLAVMADLGYQVNMGCADRSVSIHPTCRARERQKNKLHLPKLQTLRYQFLVRWTSCRKAVQRHVRKGRKHAKVLGDKARKTSRRAYRRVRRNVKRVLHRQDWFCWYPADQATTRRTTS